MPVTGGLAPEASEAGQSRNFCYGFFYGHGILK